MGLFSLGIQQQLQASSAGVQSYPRLSATIPNTIVADLFDRETLLPTGGYTMYTVASNDSNGTAVINLDRQLRLTTDSSAIGDDVDVRVSGVTMVRAADRGIPFDESKHQIDLRIKFDMVTTADTECFVGVTNDSAAIAALPTTQPSFGAFLDRSASANYFLTSGDATTQTTTDTGVAASSTPVILRALWVGDDDATLTLLTGTNLDVISATQTVTALNAQQNLQMHFFIQTEAAALKNMDIRSWSFEVI